MAQHVARRFPIDIDQHAFDRRQAVLGRLRLVREIGVIIAKAFGQRTKLAL